MDKDGVIVCGHTRWKAAAKLNLYTVPVLVAVDLSEEQIRQYRIVDNIMDLFGGSGSTLIAAQQTQRKAFLMELDGMYCDVIVARWEKFTGLKAERVASGVAV